MRLFIVILPCLLLGCNNPKEADPLMLNANNYFTSIEKNDVKLTTPQKGEWLYDHKEQPQSFQTYKSHHPTRLNDKQHIIYLQPIGAFTPLQLRALELTRQYLNVFYQTESILLPTISDSLVPKKYTRLREKDNLQLLAPYILDTVLLGKTPANAIAYMAFTSKDLFPEEKWNYVFGLASYTKRVGVTSIYRLQNKSLTDTNFTLCLKRLINVASHEIGHMFTISHCTFSLCCMNGSNSLPETDLSPNRLCSECQKKLFWNIGYNNKKRLTELAEFFSTNHLTNDYQLSAADLKALQ